MKLPPEFRGFLSIIFGRVLGLILRRKPAHTEAMIIPRKGRSIFIRHVDAGSSNAAEQEIQAIFNPVYDAERFGLHLVASPRQADVLLITGPISRNMLQALMLAFYAMPEPRSVVTVGDDIEGGLFADSYAVVALPEEIRSARKAHISGNPPTPTDIIQCLTNLP